MSDEADYHLVMPFVVCEDHGGPYNAESYTAGWEAAELASMLRQIGDLCKAHHLTVTPHRAYRTANVPQLDLIAMDAGWRLESREWDDDPYWCFLSFAPLADVHTREPDQL